MAAKTKFVRIAQEGATTDGRTITRQQIEEMARNYSPKKYGARIWLEHFRGLLPDGIFKALGDVVECKTEEVDGKLTLLARLDPTDDLVAINKARQKVFTSIEMDPNFARSGEAYLVGLAVTDSPASLGTEMLQFSANAGAANPLNARKQSPENLFTAAMETVIELEEEEAKESLGVQLLNKVKSMLRLETEKTQESFKEDLAGVTSAVEVIAESQKDVLEGQQDLQAKFTKLSTDSAEEVAVLKSSLQKLTADLEAQGKAFSELKEQLEKTPDQPTPTRPSADGNGGIIKTDC